MTPKQPPGADSARVWPVPNDRAYPCLRCRYDVRGITTGLCPECGLPLRPGYLIGKEAQWRRLLAPLMAGICAWAIVRLVLVLGAVYLAWRQMPPGTIPPAQALQSGWLIAVAILAVLNVAALVLILARRKPIALARRGTLWVIAGAFLAFVLAQATVVELMRR